MARKKTTPEEEVNVTTAAEEPAAQVVPPTEDGMPPGNTSVSEPTADAVQSAPLSLEMPTAEEAGADETPVPAQMREPVKEPEPSEKYGVDALEKAEMPPSAPSAEESDWGFQEEQKTSAPESETPASPTMQESRSLPSWNSKSAKNRKALIAMRSSTKPFMIYLTPTTCSVSPWAQARPI